ncbi:MAG: tRNA lysidine(34) synthetase TilS [Candidatus Sumerlaeaceae bacterium]|nr:tRNA lysidine(34) synthetase TilS [Candidatus Sumerlaeaceae bacterium]
MVALQHILDVARLKRRVADGATCLVGVSGGADSVCLLHTLHQHGRSHGLKLEAVHVNHMVRGQEALADYELVKRQCQELGILCHYREIEPLSHKPKGMTTEEYFREQRYRCYAEVAREQGITILALGHTADDLAESLLMHLLRGSGLRGLAFSFAARRDGLLILRPLWQTPRARILRYLEKHKRDFCHDSSNDAPDFTRNRIRKSLIPLLTREFNPNVVKTLWRTSTLFSLTDDYLRKSGRRKLKYLLRKSGDDHALPLAPLMRLHPILQFEALRQWLEQFDGTASYEHVQAMARLVSSKRGRQVRLAGGVRVEKTTDQLRLVFLKTAHGREAVSPRVEERFARSELARKYMEQHPSLPLAVIIDPVEAAPGDLAFVCRNNAFRLLDGRWARLKPLSIRQAELQLDGPRDTSLVDSPKRLIIRNRLPGDRISPGVRLKSVLINDKVPYYVRDFLIVCADEEGNIFGVAGLDRISARVHWPGAAAIRLAAQDVDGD